MREIKKIATRVSYGEALAALADEFPNLVVLDADLSAATKTSIFQKKYPDRHINCGIAECDMMGVAAGLAAEGFISVVSTFAMFAAGRAWEQVRNSIAYPQLNVKICATHGGITVGEDGASHQCNEDIALMRAIPGMTVICPADDVEARAALRAALKTDGPVYLRFGRMAVPVFNDPGDDFKIGRGRVLRSGGDVTLAATGICVWEALRAADLLAAHGISAEVISFATLKPFDGQLLSESVRKTGRAITIEEHSVIGGLGSSALEAIAEHPVPLLRIGIQDVFGCSGSARELMQLHGITAEQIADRAEAWLRNA